MKKILIFSLVALLLQGCSYMTIEAEGMKACKEFGGTFVSGVKGSGNGCYSSDFSACISICTHLENQNKDCLSDCGKYR